MFEYPVIFLAGVAGSFHCVAMCGGFACALGASSGPGRDMVVRHLTYSGGRVVSYAFLGAVAGAAGQSLSAMTPASESDFGAMQRLLAIGGGVLMLVMALHLLGFRRGARAGGFGPLAAMLRPLLTAPGAAGSLSLGVLNGFLPCPLVYAFLAQAAARADTARGAALMVAFGAGTIPAMALMGGLGRVAGPPALRRGVAVAGWFVLVLGLVTIGRGVLPMLHVVGPGHAA
jgi:sulfite exporter TauE/SafE